MTHETRQRSLPETTHRERPVEVNQYSIGKILAVWAAAALPMGALAWLVAPRLATIIDGPYPLLQVLLVLLAAGLVWQFVLVVWLVWREQGTLKWQVVRVALLRRSPRSPRTGRVGGRVWLVLIPLGLLFYAEQFIPGFAPAAGRDFGELLSSPAGASFFQDAWGWYGVTVVLWIFNTVLGEELLFRGLLLPRMNRAFGKADWLVNGVLFAAYHVHMPWAMPAILADALTLAYPTKRYQSAWIGIAVHSTQSVFLAVMVLTLVV